MIRIQIKIGIGSRILYAIWKAFILFKMSTYISISLTTCDLILKSIFYKFE